MLKLQKRGRNGASQRAGEGRGERRENGIKILLGIDPKKIRRVCMEFSDYNCMGYDLREMLIFGK